PSRIGRGICAVSDTSVRSGRHIVCRVRRALVPLVRHFLDRFRRPDHERYAYEKNGVPGSATRRNGTCRCARFQPICVTSGMLIRSRNQSLGPWLLLITLLAAFLPSTAHAQSILDRVIGKDGEQALEITELTGQVVGRLAGAAGVPIGFEAASIAPLPMRA